MVASRPGIGALGRAAAADVPAFVWDGKDPGLLVDALAAYGIDLVVLAGWLRLVPAELVRRYAGRMVNVHPALLPAFGGAGMYGIRVHRAVLASGAKVSGATVHEVDEQYDTGRILAQWPVPVRPSDSPESLAQRVLVVEHQILPAVVDAIARGADPALASWSSKTVQCPEPC